MIYRLFSLNNINKLNYKTMNIKKIQGCTSYLKTLFGAKRLTVWPFIIFGTFASIFARHFEYIYYKIFLTFIENLVSVRKTILD